MGAGGSLVAVDMAAGKQAWRLETGAEPDGRLLGVDAVGGRLLGQTRPRLGADSDKVPASLPAPLLAGGYVYAGAPDGTVFGVAGRDPGAW
jgi:outer membrane protein assembly factor BamB